MSVCSDQSASCSSLHGALPHSYNQMQTGGNIINTTAWASADRSIIHLRGLSRPSPHYQLSSNGHVSSHLFKHHDFYKVGRTFTQTKETPEPPFLMGENEKHALFIRLCLHNSLRKLYARSSCSHWNHKIVSIKLHFSRPTPSQEKEMMNNKLSY